ncbi:hypothetical protein [Sphingomonas sp.]|uniref:hypothetical protein n=1 Tax=Sphingomonas sp. TaxID=28214 RepID=UPI003B39FF21
MASQPDDRREEAAAALALLLIGRRYDLPTLIRQNKIKPRPFRQIAPTEALRSTMAAPYFDVVRAWAGERDALMRAYAVARAEGSAASITAEVDRAAIRILHNRPMIITRINAALARFEQWHRVQWAGRISAATGLDVSTLTSPSEVRNDLANASVWGQQLAQSVHQDTHGKIAAAFVAAAIAMKPAREVQGEFNAIIAKARKRAARIGVDQTEKASRAFDRARRVAAGLARFRWRHTPQKHPRDDHKARDRRIYREDRAPNDRAGTLPGCKCWEEPLYE